MSAEGNLKPVSVILKGDEVKGISGLCPLDADPPKMEEASEQTSLFSGDSYIRTEFHLKCLHNKTLL